jgi:hypothetical protein
MKSINNLSLVKTKFELPVIKAYKFVRCSILILLKKLFVVAFVRCRIVRSSIPYCT